MKRYLNLNRAGAALLVAASLTLAACGGGSGGGGGGSKKDPTSPSVEAAATGVASKGILKSAAVKAIELDPNGRELRVLGKATTKDDGRYSLTIEPSAGYQGGPVLFELTATEDTRMVCDVPAGCGDVPFGGDVSLDDDFKLQAIVPSVESGKTISVQITPFTTMAARRALADDAGVSTKSVNDANSAVSQILGVSVLTTEPADLTKPDNNVRDDAKIYGAFLAGVGTMAMESSGVRLSDFIDQLATTFEDGSFDPDDPVSIDELVTKVEKATQSDKLFPEGAPALVTQSVATLKDNVKEGSYKPKPSEHANEPALAKAKALVADARTLATSVAELEEPLDAFKGNLEAAEQVFNNDSKALLETVALAVDTVLAAVDEGELKANSSAKLPLYGDVGQVTANLTEDAHGTRLDIGPLDLDSGTNIDLNLALGTSLKLSEVLGEKQFAVREASLSLQGFTGNDQIQLSLDNVELRVALRQNVKFDPATADFVEDAQLQTGSLRGKLTLTHAQNNVSFTGSAEARFVELEAKAAAPRRTNHGSMKYLHVAGTLSSPNGSFDASVTFDLDNAATFDTLAFLDHQSWVWVDRTVAGDVLGVKKFAADEGIDNLSWANYISWANYNGDETYIVDDSFVSKTFPGDVLGVENYIREHYEHYNALEDFYGDIQFSYLGYYYETSTDKSTFWFDIDLGSFENAERFAKGKLTLALDLDLKGHPATKAIMTVNRSGFDSGDATVTFERPGSKWTVSAKKDDGKDVSSVDVTNPDGVKMTLTRQEESGDVSGAITVDGKKVGDVETASNGLILLRWIDGTFETLY